jgi:hypothetical protein
MRVRPLFRVGPPHSAGPPLSFQYLALRQPDYRPAVLIGPVSLVFFPIAVSPLRYETPLCSFLQYAALRRARVPVRRAVFRARRRDVLCCPAARAEQSQIRRGAIFHRIHGASSQALWRRPFARPKARYRASRRPWSAPVLIRRSGAPYSNRARRYGGRPHGVCPLSGHAWAPKSLRSFNTARAETSVSLAAGSPM